MASSLLLLTLLLNVAAKSEPEPRQVTIKQGELLDLTHGEADKPREWSAEVVQMFDAISANRPDLINAALDKGVNINIRGPSGYTPLFESVLKHHVHSVELLLRRGANFRLRNDQGFDALDAAAFGGCAMCAHKLIRAGLDPTAVRYDGFNVLHRAIWGDTAQHTELVRVILEAGVAPSTLAKTKKGDVHPINMVNENEATKQLLEEWLEKEARGELPPPYAPPPPPPKKELSPRRKAEIADKLVKAAEGKPELIEKLKQISKDKPELLERLNALERDMAVKNEEQTQKESEPPEKEEL